MQRLPLFVLFVSVAAVGFAAETFRVENDLRWGNAAPVRSTTLFDGTVFYNLIGANGEITVFDPQKDTFTLLDPELRLQTHLAVSETKRFIDAQRIQLESHKNEFVAFAAKPVFIMEFDEVGGQMALQSSWVDYTLTTKAFPDAATAKAYLDFCDWTCYLNQRITPGLTMPLIRLEVNRILREKSRFPTNIKVSIFPTGKKFLGKEENIQATHELSRRLSEADRQRIARTHELMRTFTVVPFAVYQTKVAEKSRTPTRK